MFTFEIGEMEGCYLVGHYLEVESAVIGAAGRLRMNDSKLPAASEVSGRGFCFQAFLLLKNVFNQPRFHLV